MNPGHLLRLDSLTEHVAVAHRVDPERRVRNEPAFDCYSPRQAAAGSFVTPARGPEQTVPEDFRPLLRASVIGKLQASCQPTMAHRWST
jgi:hypothetical protein